MFRPTALRSIQRSLPSCQVSAARSAWRSATFKAQLTSQASAANSAKRLSLTVRKPLTTSLVRYQSTIDRAAEAEYGKRILQPEPETVSTGSSIRHVTGEVGVDTPEPDVDMMAGIKGDFVSSGYILQLVESRADMFVFCRKLLSIRSRLRMCREKPSMLVWQVSCLTLPLPFLLSTWPSTSNMQQTPVQAFFFPERLRNSSFISSNPFSWAMAPR